MRIRFTTPFAVSAALRASRRWRRAPVCRARRFGYASDAAGRRTAISRSGETFGDLSGATDAYGYNSRREIFSAALSALPTFAQGEVRSGMNASTTYTVKHIQLLTLLPHKLDLAHPFEEKGTWNGEVTVDCCDKGKGGDK